tara:strand:- start:159 stop:548 length:390 start_codon:yes stop_codon:yes gene_type:complete
MKNNSNSNNLRMNNTNDVLNLLCLIGLFVLVFFTAISESKRLKDVGHKITDGNINTLLILVIIVLVMTENLQVGFLLLVIYTVLLFRFNVKKNNEGFKPGPSPLDCKTYGDTNKRVGSAFYPLHEEDEE